VPKPQGEQFVIDILSIGMPIAQIMLTIFNCSRVKYRYQFSNILKKSIAYF